MSTQTTINTKPVEILLVEDNPGDARLTLEGFKDAKVQNNISIVEDGVEAMAFLRREEDYANAARPDLILLDLNMPKKDGRQVLTEIKADENLKDIPVLVFTTSSAEADILKSYNLQANAFITKPIDFGEFLSVVKSLEEFWLTIVKLPSRAREQSHA